MDGDSMSGLKILGITGSGGLGVLVAGLLASEMFDLNVTGILAVALLIFVMGGAGALVLRNM